MIGAAGDRSGSDSARHRGRRRRGEHDTVEGNTKLNEARQQHQIDDPPAKRRAAAAPGRADRERRRAGPGSRPRARPRPSRREARQRADRDGRAGQGRRLRDRAGDRRGPGHPARARRSARSTTSARNRPAASRRRRLGHLQPGHRPLRDADRGRPWEGDSAASVALARLTRADPRPDDGPPVRAARPRLDHPQGARAGPSDRWPSAAAMADALEATLRPAVERRRRCGRGSGGRPAWPPGRRWCPRRPAPTRAASPTSPDAYAGAESGRAGHRAAARPLRRCTGRATADEERARRARWSGSPASSPSPLLAAIAFLVFQLASGRRDGRSSRSPCRTSSGLDGRTRSPQAAALGLTLTPTGQLSTDDPEGTILAQDPVPGTKVDRARRSSRSRSRPARARRRSPTSRTRPSPRRSQAISDAGLVGVRTDRGVRSARAGRPRRPPEPARRRHRGQGHAGRLRRVEGPRTDAVADPDPDADADADPDADPDADADAHADADPRARRRRPRTRRRRPRARPSRRLGRARALAASAPRSRGRAGSRRRRSRAGRRAGPRACAPGRRPRPPRSRPAARG